MGLAGGASEDERASVERLRRKGRRKMLGNDIAVSVTEP
jgi:hypothetical protein